MGEEECNRKDKKIHRQDKIQKMKRKFQEIGLSPVSKDVNCRLVLIEY